MPWSPYLRRSETLTAPARRKVSPFVTQIVVEKRIEPIWGIPNQKRIMALILGRSKALFLAAAAVAVVLLSACSRDSQPTPPGFSVVQPVPAETVELSGEGETAIPPPSSQARPGGALGFSHFAFEEIGGVVITTLVEGPAGEQVRSNLSYLQLKQIYDQGDPPPEELQMTREE